MLNQGDILRGRYTVIKRLGQGGMGAVYEAHDNVFDTSVALKEVIIDFTAALDTKAQEMAQAAFEREAKLLAKINHETIPHVKDYFIENSSQFLVMELVDGDDLSKMLKERGSAFPMATLLDWTDHLLDALDYLHSMNPPIIHRDIKPQNLKLTTRGKIKLLDFGIAKGTEAQSQNTVTNQTFIAATLNYSPIEQMIRVLDPTFLAVITHKYGPQVEYLLAQNADVRTDIFALGATLYHLATNRHPAEAIKRGVEIWDGKPDPLEDPRSLNPEISDEFAAFLLKSMQISRDHRFGSAGEMRGALHHLMDVSTKQSLTPTVEMNFQEMTGDATTPMITVPEVPQSPAVDTAGRGHGTSEIKTEVFTGDTGGSAMQSIGAASQATAFAEQPQEPKKKRSKLIWLVPIAGVLLIMLAGGVLGVILIARQFIQEDPGPDNSNVNIENTESTPEETPDSSPDITNSSSPEASPESSESPEATIEIETGTPNSPNVKTTPKPNSTVKSTPRPTVKPTVKPTRPVVVRTPPPVKTPAKTPKKNMDCIFTDSCK